MKKAVILVGEHLARKSLAINKYLKPYLGIGRYAHKFTLNGKNGYVHSQSFEEALGDFLEHIRGCFAYDLVVFAARPEKVYGSKLHQLRDASMIASFAVSVVHM